MVIAVHHKVAKEANLHIVPLFSFMHRAMKGDKLPRFWPEAVLLSKGLNKAWIAASKDFFDAIKKAFPEGSSPDKEAYRQALHILDNTGAATAKAALPGIRAVINRVVGTARGDFSKLLKKASTADVVGSHWEEWLKKSAEDQLNEYVKSYPDRFIHPVVQRAFETVTDAPERYTQAFANGMVDRLDALHNANPYWEGLSSVEVSTLWHSEGVMMASEQGYSAYQIVNPRDAATCPVCRQLSGQIVPVADAKDRVLKWASNKDPEAISEQFPFPKLEDVQGKTIDEIKEGGFLLPPYHPWCRDEVVPLWKEGPDSLQEAGLPKQWPEKGLEIFPGDIMRAARYETELTEFAGMDVAELKAVAQENFADFEAMFIKEADPEKEDYLQWLIKEEEKVVSEPRGTALSEADRAVPDEVKLSTDEYVKYRALQQSMVEQAELGKTVEVFVPVRASRDTEALLSVLEGEAKLAIENQPLKWALLKRELAMAAAGEDGLVLVEMIKATDIFSFAEQEALISVIERAASTTYRTADQILRA